MDIKFNNVKLSAGFQMNKYDKTIWIKCSGRTARLLNSPRKAYFFRQNEHVYVLRNNNFYIQGELETA